MAAVNAAVPVAALVHAVAGHARQRPGATALVWGERQVSYGELWAAALRAGERIRSLHLPPTAAIGLRVDKTPDAVALVLGALASGHPFLLPSTGNPAPLLDRMFATAGCARVLDVDVVEERPVASAAEPPAGTGFMLTTSGSTGTPKIVPLPAAGVDAFTGWVRRRFGVGPGTAVLSYAPLSFDLSLFDVWATLAAGGTSVLVRAGDALNAARLAELVVRWRVRVVQGVPMMHGLLAGTGTVFGSVRHALSTGDVMPGELVSALPRVFPRARLYNLYGCTETNDSLLHEIDPVRDAAGPLPLGGPLPGVRTSIVDTDGATVPGAGSGELWVRTPFQSPGYLGAAPGGRFVPHPGDPAGPVWYRSGDLVRRDRDGTLVLLGRTDSRVKVRGVGVDLGDIEHTLLTHTGVAEAVVLAETDPLGGRLLRAVVRRTPGHHLNSLDLRRHCARTLPGAALPQHLHIVDEPLPRNANGKYDRAATGRRHSPPTERA